jgi:hypothetical protein
MGFVDHKLSSTAVLLIEYKVVSFPPKDIRAQSSESLILSGLSFDATIRYCRRNNLPLNFHSTNCYWPIFSVARSTQRLWNVETRIGCVEIFKSRETGFRNFKFLMESFPDWAHFRYKMRSSQWRYRIFEVFKQLQDARVSAPTNPISWSFRRHPATS